MKCNLWITQCQCLAHWLSVRAYLLVMHTHMSAQQKPLRIKDYLIDDTPYVNQALSAILLGQTEAGP